MHKEIRIPPANLMAKHRFFRFRPNANYTYINLNKVIYYTKLFPLRAFSSILQ